MGSILFVDDDRDALTIYERAISLEGHQAFLVSSGEEALDRVGEVQPDVIVLDVNLPDMSGFYLLERLRQETISRDIPVIMLTAHDDSGMAQQFLEAGANAFYSKPLSLTKFLNVLEEYL